MYSYIKGEVVELSNNYIVLENNGIGYMIYVSNPYAFQSNEKYTVYVYQHVKEDDLALYGFLTKSEKELFLKLITVKGIGCKTGIGILATGDVDAIINAIENQNIAYLKRIPGIGPKAAQQIILDLQGKFSGQVKDTVLISKDFEEAIDVLVALGYKRKEVEKVMDQFAKHNYDTNTYVKKALSMLVKL